MAIKYTVSPTFKIGATSYDVLEASYEYDPEMIETLSNASFFPDYTLGNIKASITVKTNDYTLAALAFKGSEHTDVEISLKVAHNAALTSPEEYTFGTGTVAFKIGNARVTEKVSVGGSADKKNSEFSITFTAARVSSTNADPGITITSALS